MINSDGDDLDYTQELKMTVNMLSNSGGRSTACDDVTNAELDPEGIREARKINMQFFEKMNAYGRCPRSCVEEENGKLVHVKWIDTNKGDASRPNYRSRLVGRDFNEYKDDALYASTPPLEAMRVILSDAATVDDDTNINNNRLEVMINDMSRAYFHAPATRTLFMKLLVEGDDATDRYVGRLNVCSYGTRDAAKGWQQTLTKHMESIGFDKGKDTQQCLTTLREEFKHWCTATTTCHQAEALTSIGWRGSWPSSTRSRPRGCGTSTGNAR